MVYKDIVVEVPKKKRIAKRGQQSCVYEILERKSNSTKKTDVGKDIVCSIGVLKSDDDTKMYPNDNYFKLHPEAIPIGEKDPDVFDDTLRVGADFVIETAFNDLGLDVVMRDIFGDKFGTIKSLIHYYNIMGESSSQQYKYFMFNHYTEMENIPSEATISRLFNKEIDNSKINEFKELWMKHELEKISKGDCKICVDFDSTNFNTASDNIDLAEYGHAKDDEELPVYNVAYFVNQETGIPILYDLYFGSTVDMAHIKIALKKLELDDESRKKITFVMDRGYFSKKNIKNFCSKEDPIDFIVMGKDNTVSDFLISKYGKELQDNAIYWMEGCDDVSGIRIEHKPFPSMDDMKEKLYVYLYFSEEKQRDEKASFNKKLEKSIELIKEMIENNNIDKNENIRKVYKKYLDVLVTQDHRICAYTKNVKNQNEVWSKAGYFWIVSNLEKTPKEIYEMYKDRDEIEKCVRGIKNSLDFGRMYAQNDYTIESKVLISFIGAVVRTWILSKIKAYTRKHSSECFTSVIGELDKIQIYKKDKDFIYKYLLTAKQKEILKCFNIDEGKMRTKLSQINKFFQKE